MSVHIQDLGQGPEQWVLESVAYLWIQSMCTGVRGRCKGTFQVSGRQRRGVELGEHMWRTTGAGWLGAVAGKSGCRKADHRQP